MSSGFNEKALRLLTEAGIKAEILHGVLTVNRTSMCNVYPDLEEGAGYDAVLNDLRQHFDGMYLYWSGRTDEWIGISAHVRS